MPFPIGAVIGAASGIASGLLGQSAAEKLNKENRAWQEKMRATQYQTTVRDMRAAGINPMALYSGSGLSSGMAPAGVQPQTQLAEAVGSASSKAIGNEIAIAQLRDINAARRMKEEQAETIAQTRAIDWNDWLGKNPGGDMTSWGRAQRDQLLQGIANQRASENNTNADTELKKVQAELYATQKKLTELGIPKEAAYSAMWKKYPKAMMAGDIGSKFISKIRIPYF